MKKLNKKSLKYGSYAIAATAVVIAIIVVFNALLGIDSVRNRLRFDITQNKMYSLSEQSINLVKKLDKNVEIIILSEESKFNTTEILEVLKQYGLKSNGKITTKFVDVEKDPLYIKRELDPNQVQGIESGSIVVKSGDRIKVVSQNDMVEYDYSTGYPQASGLKIEQTFTSAIQSVLAANTPVIYFATGHGELSPDKELSDLKATIASNNYEVKNLNLTNEIPDDAKVIFFVSPKTDLLAKEQENLLKYMEKGGDAVFLMDVQTNGAELANFEQVYERYSLGLNNDFVVEGDQNWYYNDFNIIIPQPGDNDVTTNLDPDSLFVYMPNCRSVTIGQTSKEWITTQPLFKTSSKSQSQDLATKETKSGPFILGALSTYSGTDESKVALIGNATFVTNDWMKSAGENGKRYVMSILNWMQNQEGSVYIESKSLGSQPINLTAQSKFIAFIVLSFLLPIAVIGLGVFVWIRRKHL
jgi:hypothetical protein